MELEYISMKKYNIVGNRKLHRSYHKNGYKSESCISEIRNGYVNRD